MPFAVAPDLDRVDDLERGNPPVRCRDVDGESVARHHTTADARDVTAFPIAPACLIRANCTNLRGASLVGSVAVPAATTTTADDAALVARVRGGDTAAFGELYRRHAGAVHVAVRDNVQDPDAAADVVQDAFARALESLPKLREAERFRPWLLSIARHAAIDHRRVRGRLVPSEDEYLDRTPDASFGPEKRAELSELARLVDAHVGGLSQRDATALAMVTHLGYTPEEVAGVLGVAVGTANVIVHRARRRLRDALTLELMVKRKGRGCAEFQARFDKRDLVGAGRHVRDCDVCAEITVSEVNVYDASAPQPDEA